MSLFSESLVGRLSRRLIALQLLAVTLVAIFALIPSRMDQRGELQLDDEILGQIARNLADEGGVLSYHRDRALSAIIAEHPEFWFFVIDETSREVQHGPVPDRVRKLLDDFASSVRAEIRWKSTSPAINFIAERMASPIGTVVIASGGGPLHYPVADRFRTVYKYYLSLLALLTATAVLVIPWVLRKEFRGLARVAEEAQRIDIDQPGTRLSENDVPVEMQGMVQAVNAALSRLDEGIEQRRRFLAAAAHELRTPVAILSMRIEILPPGPERNRLMLDVARLASLADQLLDLERMESAQIRLVAVDLVDLVEQAAMDIAPLAVAYGAEISLEAPSDPVMVSADRQAMARVVTNLVQNAIAHGGAGTVIQLEVALPGELRVRDDGPGIAPADRARVFEPFIRQSSESTGAGLGLNLVKQIVTRHGGTVHATQSSLGGAEFIVRLPSVE